MLPKSNRLNIKTHFTQIRGNGKKLTSPYFSFYYRKNPDRKTIQVNSIVSKKVSKSAVKRNRMKRVLSTVIQKHLSELDNNLQGLFFVYKDFSTLKSSEIESIIIKTFSNAEILKTSK